MYKTASNSSVGTLEIFAGPRASQKCLLGSSPNGISAAAGLASLEYILEHDLISAAAEKGEYFIGELKRIGEKYPGIFKEIRGKGLMIGLETYETPEAYKLQFGDYYADAFEKSVKKIYETVNG